jgi:hypothetical protein
MIEKEPCLQKIRNSTDPRGSIVVGGGADDSDDKVDLFHL